MNLRNLPEINFAQKDTAEIEKSVITMYEALTGRTLAKGDPVRLFLLSIAAVIVQQRVLIDYTGKQNLLAYAEGTSLDHIGVLVGTERLQPTAATTTLRAALSAVRQQATIIPAGMRVTAGDEVFFMTSSVAVIPPGSLTAEVDAICMHSGAAGNGYAADELKIIVDPQPFIASITNLTVTEGGSDRETDEAMRERIRQAPESFSCAGPDGAYRYHAMRASALIADVSVDSPRPGEVEVRPLLKNGEIPGEEILASVRDVLNDRKIRPLTDKVTVSVPEPIDYAIDFTYWISNEETVSAAAIQAAVEQAVNEFEIWQREKLGRDLNPTELIYRVRAVGAKRVEIRSPAFMVTSLSQVPVAGAKKIVFGGLEDV